MKFANQSAKNIPDLSSNYEKGSPSIINYCFDTLALLGQLLCNEKRADPGRSTFASWDGYTEVLKALRFKYFCVAIPVDVSVVRAEIFLKLVKSGDGDDG